VRWLLVTGPVDWLVGIALRARVASLRGAPADGERNVDGITEMLTPEEEEEEVEVVARAIDPAVWRGFDAYVRKLGLNADDRTAARRHAHGPTLPSLKRAYRAIAALDAFRKAKRESETQDGRSAID